MTKSFGTVKLRLWLKEKDMDSECLRLVLMLKQTNKAMICAEQLAAAKTLPFHLITTFTVVNKSGLKCSFETSVIKIWQQRGLNTIEQGTVVLFTENASLLR